MLTASCQAWHTWCPLLHVNTAAKEPAERGVALPLTPLLLACIVKHLLPAHATAMLVLMLCLGYVMLCAHAVFFGHTLHLLMPRCC
jgi:hypothetical protein